jgi:threonine dehydrogenase-like Zn-dependent dehydrogenase
MLFGCGLYLEPAKIGMLAAVTRRNRLALVQQITAPRGTLVLKSTFHGAAPVEMWPIVVKEITVVGSRCGPFPPALALLRTGRVDPRPLISRVST